MFSINTVETRYERIQYQHNLGRLLLTFQEEVLKGRFLLTDPSSLLETVDIKRHHGH